MQQNETPLTSAGDGRAPGGRFAPGNKAGKGNPNNKRTQLIRNQLLKAATRTDVVAICAALVEGAKGGDLKFIQEWFDRTIGKAAPAELLERIERLEKSLTFNPITFDGDKVTI